MAWGPAEAGQMACDPAPPEGKGEERTPFLQNCRGLAASAATGWSEWDPDEGAWQEEEEDGVESEIFVGVRLRTTLGEGQVEALRSFEGREYCTIRLDSSGTASMPRTAAEAAARKARRREALRATLKPDLIGHIRMYNPAKGWGFIVCDAFEGDIFLHSKHRMENMVMPYIGHNQTVPDGANVVKFDLDLQDPLRPSAIHVRSHQGAEGGQQQCQTPCTIFPAAAAASPRNAGSAASTTSPSRAREAGAEPTCSPNCAVPSGAPSPLPVPLETRCSPGGRHHNSSSGGGSPKEGGGSSSSGTQSPLPARAKDSAESPKAGNAASAAADVGRSPAHIGTGDLSASTMKDRPVLWMRGIPWTASEADVASFFVGFGVRADDVTLLTRRNGSRSGDAYIRFVREELATKAMQQRNLKHMGKRYIELFPVQPGLRPGEGAERGPSKQTLSLAVGVPPEEVSGSGQPPSGPLAPTALAAAAQVAQFTAAYGGAEWGGGRMGAGETQIVDLAAQAYATAYCLHMQETSAAYVAAQNFLQFQGLPGQHLSDGPREGGVEEAFQQHRYYNEL